jgi:hypothetical protein
MSYWSRKKPTPATATARTSGGQCQLGVQTACNANFLVHRRGDLSCQSVPQSQSWSVGAHGRGQTGTLSISESASLLRRFGSDMCE